MLSGSALKDSNPLAADHSNTLHVIAHSCRLHLAFVVLPTDRPSDRTMGANGQSDAAANLDIHEVSLRAAVSGRRRDADEDSRRRLEHQPRVLQRLRRRRLARPAAAGNDPVSRGRRDGAGPPGHRRRAFRCARVGELSPAAGRGRRRTEAPHHRRGRHDHPRWRRAPAALQQRRDAQVCVQARALAAVRAASRGMP